MKDRLYTYRVFDIRVIDGDTIEATLDLGFYIYRKIRLRLTGYDAPEVRGSEKPLGLRAKQRLKEILSQYPEWVIRTHKDTGIYGRYYGELFSIDGENVNEKMRVYCEKLLGETNVTKK